MEAGRGMDVLVALEVMGHERTRLYTTPQMIEMYVPHYSTDIAAAWQVVEKMQAYPGDTKDHVFHAFCTALEDNEGGSWLYQSKADAAAYLICRAALTAVAQSDA